MLFETGVLPFTEPLWNHRQILPLLAHTNLYASVNVLKQENFGFAKKKDFQ
jgi:hypothetical protein